MEKLNMKTKDLASDNIAKLSALFPEIITEVEKGGKIINTINADKLKELIGDYAENSSEVYELTWVGKQKSRQNIVLPIHKTLRPVVKDSVDFENTENLYIEGDNFEILKLLQESYLNQIKMIYIDPPYNTGNDFVYKDNFSMCRERYDDETGAIDEEGNKLFKNTAVNGRFHSDWLSMMYERLVIAKDLLSDDGVIFISIDDNEVANLRKICDEIFGDENFVAQFPWRKRTAKSDVPFGISQDYEWLLCFAKSSLFIADIEGVKRKYFESPDLPNRPWRIHDMTTQRTALERPNSNFTIINPKNGEKYPVNPNAVWRVTSDTFQKFYSENRIIFPGEYNFLNISKPVLRYFKDDDITKAGERFGFTHVSTNLPKEVGMTQDGTKDIGSLFENKIFSFPKPVSLLKYLIKFTTSIDKSATILDFFSGSATTAHAVMQLNSEDGSNRKFIMVQLPEPTAEDSEALRAGYKNIAEIGKERIKRAANKIQDELKDKQKQQTLDETDNDTSKMDFGFRVFKLDSSNMKDIYYNPKDIDQRTLTNFRDNIKEDRTDKDLLFQVLLELAIPISAKVTEEKVNNKTIYRINDNFLIACFDDDVDLETITKIAQLNPLRIVFKDSSFKDDAAKVNCDEYLKNKLPNTIVKVI
ncbi:MAG: DNA methyltransferase [Candidatus Methanoperedens sp.]